jgi:hypothetical protein
MNYPGTDKTMIAGTIKGTVLSGRVDQTTLGNTMRVLSYIDYMAYKAGM